MGQQATRHYGSLQDYQRVRDELLTRIVAVLATDPRVGTAWLSGSFGRGEEDAWADLDLHVAVIDEYLDAFLDERDVLYRQVGTPVLVQGEMASDAMASARFQLVLFDGPVEVDWNIGPLTKAVRPVTSCMLVERTPVPTASLPPLSTGEWQRQATSWLVFFWAMAPIAVKYAGRGETRQAVQQLDLLSRASIALWRLLHDPVSTEPQLNWTNRVLEPELDRQLPQLEPTINPFTALATIRAHCVAVERFHSEFARRGVPVPAAMPAQVTTLCDLAESVLHQGIPARRPYR